jgi:CRP-like cAMP-binding protein
MRSGLLRDPQTLPHLKNQLLARLGHNLFAAVKPFLTTVALNQGDVLAHTHGYVQKVYFPHQGIISSVVLLEDGRAIEIGMIGNDGQYGAGPVMHDKLSINHVMVQVSGSASVIEADRLRFLVQEIPPFQDLLIAYEQFFLAQVQQTAACNAVHDVYARSCKWLLRMRRLVGEDFPLTQEFLAQMMGVRRTSVNSVAQELQERGLISYGRGRIRIKDLEGIAENACECEAALAAQFERLFGQQDWAENT